MSFDIRNYNSQKQTDSKQEEFWTVKYLRHVDDFFPKINSECENLLKFRNKKTEDAFNNKVDAWKAFVQATQKLCQLYKVRDAKCLSKKN